MQTALRDAGADVIGPCPNEDAARARLSAQRPHAVVLDINLGAGASFSLAQHLRSNDIPFVLVTGYDASVIPAAYANVERLEKPVQPPRLVDAIERLLHLRV